MALVNAAANIADAHTEGLHDILTRAFGIAMTELDTNPYRAEKRKLTSERNQAIQLNDQAKADHPYV